MARIGCEVFIATWVACLIASSRSDTSQSLQSLLEQEEVELCSYLGGDCMVGYCRRELRHRWGIPLCQNSKICCTKEPTTLSPVTTTMSNRVPTRAEVLNQCRSQHGVCHAWYNNCTEGEVVQLECDHVWQSCCLPTVQPSLRVESTAALPVPPAVPQSSREQSLKLGQCGQQVRTPRQKRIIGGSLSPPGTWPWHVGISSALGHVYCAGTVIDRKWILTAAHCFKKIKDFSRQRVFSRNRDDGTQKTYSIKRIVKHSLYEEHNHSEMIDHSHKYDIALVELNDHIEFNDYIQPVCLPSTDDAFEERACWLAGWGSTRYNSTEDTLRLRQVRGSVLSSSACKAHWGNLVDSKMLCFGNDHRGGCAGDSGGGLFCENAKGRYVIAGVISWGSADCNQRATVLTNISPYHDWIKTTLKV
ncbi:chymotrypsinogen A-like [Watersipora subatra]|uniref:chymotrypsinogen A-like n=1 Tax=Watersipora subatra TaxID=2589382 RepID=UPI00355BFE8B